MLRVQLSEQERDQLRSRLANRKLSHEAHTRLRIVHLSAGHLSPPKIAALLGWHENSVRKWIKRFQHQGFDGLVPRKSPGPQPRYTQQQWQALEDMLDSTDRTFTSGQIAAWMKEKFGLSMNAVYLSQVLKSRGWRYKRTKRTLDHNRPDPQIVAAASEKLAAFKKAGSGWVRGSAVSGSERLLPDAADRL